MYIGGFPKLVTMFSFFCQQTLAIFFFVIKVFMSLTWKTRDKESISNLYFKPLFDSSVQRRCTLKARQITAQSAKWGRNVQSRRTDRADSPRVRRVGWFVASFVSDPGLTFPFNPSSKRKIWKKQIIFDQKQTLNREHFQWLSVHLTTSPCTCLLKLINHCSWFEDL